MAVLSPYTAITTKSHNLNYVLKTRPHRTTPRSRLRTTNDSNYEVKPLNEQLSLSRPFRSFEDIVRSRTTDYSPTHSLNEFSVQVASHSLIVGIRATIKSHRIVDLAMRKNFYTSGPIVLISSEALEFIVAFFGVAAGCQGESLHDCYVSSYVLLSRQTRCNYLHSSEGEVSRADLCTRGDISTLNGRFPLFRPYLRGRSGPGPSRVTLNTKDQAAKPRARPPQREPPGVPPTTPTSGRPSTNHPGDRFAMLRRPRPARLAQTPRLRRLAARLLRIQAQRRPLRSCTLTDPALHKTVLDAIRRTCRPSMLCWEGSAWASLLYRYMGDTSVYSPLRYSAFARKRSPEVVVVLK
ncbi:unnamed protein product [Trichogramma brassicae]|uniref:Uncharacterized protein n=1 Tax=Trichogramma brassicae TaxID=86971 RepID=A0A6H5J1A5_9HYME|nr:unnamed protein product [Trichogramma brassicae]